MHNTISSSLNLNKINNINNNNTVHVIDID